MKRPTRTGEYCSNACQSRVAPSAKGKPKSAEARAKISAAHTGMKKPWLVQPPVVVTCQQCGKVTEYTGRRRHTAKQQRFCGLSCTFEWWREHPEEHPTFIDGGARTRSFGKNWREQAALARERDGYTCQVCGLHRMKPALPVHHIRPRREFQGDWITANDLSNLITVCPGCHKQLEPPDSR